MNRFKKWLLTAVSAVMAVSCCAGVAGCGADNSKIQIWAGTYWGGDNQEVLQSMVDKWNVYARENGKSEAELSIKQDMRGNMTTGAISGRIGDVIMWDRWESLRLANQAIFLPIDDKLTAAGHSADEFNAAAMSETLYNGQHYGIPFDLDTWGLFVNRNLYLNWAQSVTDADTLAWLVNEGKTDVTTVGEESSKYNYPEDWNEFYTAARGCTKKNGNTIETAGMSVDVEFVAWLATAGGAVANVEEGKIVLHTDDPIPGDKDNRTYKQATESVLKFLDKLIDQDGDTPEEREQAVTSFTFFSSSSTLDYFLQEKVAFKVNSLLNGMTTYNKYKTDDFAFDFIPFPSAPGLDKRGGLLGGYSMSIPKRAPHTEAAWELIEWWVLNDENYKTWTNIAHLIPTRTEIMNEVRNDTKIMGDAPYLKVAIDNIANYAVRPPHIAYSMYETNVQSPALDVYLRRQTQGASDGSDTLHMSEFFRKIKNSSDLNTYLGV